MADGDRLRWLPLQRDVCHWMGHNESCHGLYLGNDDVAGLRTGFCMDSRRSFSSCFVSACTLALSLDRAACRSPISAWASARRCSAVDTYRVPRSATTCRTPAGPTTGTFTDRIIHHLGQAPIFRLEFVEQVCAMTTISHDELVCGMVRSPAIPDC